MNIAGAVLRNSPSPSPYTDTQPLVVENLKLEEPGPTELLVKIEAAGLCHSDLSVVNGDRPRPVPMLLGHEASGIVESVGDAVTDVFTGDRVVLTFLPRCGECEACQTDGKLPCERGTTANENGTLLSGTDRLRDNSGNQVFHHLGCSAFATKAVVDRRSVVPVDQDVPPTVAALLGCAVLTGGGAVLNAGKPNPQDDIIVVGLGGVGMSALLVARAVTKGRVIGIDEQLSKLELAKELGADEVFTPDQAVKEGTNAPVVIEAAGHPNAFESAFSLTAPGGITVTVGLPNPAAVSRISPLTMTAESRTVVGSYLGSSVPSRDIPRFVEMWRKGKLPLEKLISSEIALEDLNGALDALASGQALRQIIRL